MAVTTATGGTVETLPDGSALLRGTNPETNIYTVTLESPPGEVAAVRLEALTDAALGHNGPGRTPHGNFVLTEISATVAPSDAPAKPQTIRFRRAEADGQQDGFPASAAIDGKPDTGWAIQGPGNWNVNRALTLTLDKPLSLPKGRKVDIPPRTELRQSAYYRAIPPERRAFSRGKRFSPGSGAEARTIRPRFCRMEKGKRGKSGSLDDSQACPRPRGCPRPADSPG